MGVKPAQIELSIEELILDAGVASALSPRALQTLRIEIEEELARLFQTEGAPAHFERSSQIDSVDAGRLRRGHTQQAGRVERLGAQIAQSVYRSLER